MGWGEGGAGRGCGMGHTTPHPPHLTQPHTSPPSSAQPHNAPPHPTTPHCAPPQPHHNLTPTPPTTPTLPHPSPPPPPTPTPPTPPTPPWVTGEVRRAGAGQGGMRSGRVGAGRGGSGRLGRGGRVRLFWQVAAAWTGHVAEGVLVHGPMLGHAYCKRATFHNVGTGSGECPFTQPAKIAATTLLLWLSLLLSSPLLFLLLLLWCGCGCG